MSGHGRLTIVYMECPNLAKRCEVDPMDKSSNGNPESLRTSARAARAVPREGDGDVVADATADVGVFDYEQCLSRLGGDRELFDEVLQIFLEDAPLLLAQAAASLANGDIAALERATHTLKGLSANFAAPAATTAAYTVELLAREHRLDSAATCFPQLEAEVHRLEMALRNFRGHRS